MRTPTRFLRMPLMVVAFAFVLSWIVAPALLADDRALHLLPPEGGSTGQPYGRTVQSMAVAGADVNASNIAGNEAEVSIDVNPTNPSNLVVVGHAPAFATMNTFYTMDGGQTWTLVALGDAHDGLTSTFRFDPTVAFDDNGNVYAGYGARTVTATGVNQITVVVCRSTDGGQTYPQAAWVSTTPDIGSLPGNDKWHLATGPDPFTAAQQDVYIAWTQNVLETSAVDQRIVFSGSTDSGATFSAPLIINDTSIAGTRAGNLFADPAVGPGGEVYVTWADFFATPNEIYIDASFDGGATFGTDTLAATSTLGWAASIPAQPRRRISAGPVLDADRCATSPNLGRVYLTYVDLAAGGSPDTDVLVQFSDTSGTTWSATTVVHDDGGTNSQFLPWVDVDQTNGYVTATWYDARNDVNNEKVEVFQTHSTDGGATFEPNVLVSDGQSDQSWNNPTSWAGNYLEYIGIASYGCVSTLVWSDNSLNLADLDYFTDNVVFCSLVSCMDIKPGSDPNSINPRSNGVIPVAIMGTTTQDVNDIDPTTVRFGPNLAGPAHKELIHYEDVNADGFMDAVFHFRTQQTGIQHGDTEACIIWTTYGGTSYSCCDSVRTVPPHGKRKPMFACGGTIGVPMPPEEIIGALLPFLLIVILFAALRLRPRLRPEVNT